MSFTMGHLVNSVAFNSITQGLADVLCQDAERRYSAHNNNSAVMAHPSSPTQQPHPYTSPQTNASCSIAWDRTFRFTVASGLVGGVLNYAIFNGFLPSFLPGRSIGTILAKVAFNNTIAKALSAFVVIGTTALLEGRDTQYIKRKLEIDVTSSIWLALAFWGPSQTLMFMFVNERYHTHIISTLGVIYSAMYSYIVHREVTAEPAPALLNANTKRVRLDIPD